MRSWSVAFILHLHLLLLCTAATHAYQSSEYFPFYSQNVTKTLQVNLPFADTNDAVPHDLAINHSVYRRQAPLNTATSQRARLRRTPSYIVLGPRVIRPAQIVALSVTILRKEWSPLLVKALISNDDVAVASSENSFMVDVPQTLEMRIPNNIRGGNYRLTIEGKLPTGERKFYNISQLIFEQKAVSILIQLNRPIFRQEAVVQFRCIPIYPDLAGYYLSVDAYLIGPSGHVLRKWENQQTTAGIVSLQVIGNGAHHSISHLCCSSIP